MLTIKTLAFSLWLAATSFIPPGDQTRAYSEPEQAAAGRYWDFAEAVAYVVLDAAEEPLPLDSDDDEARARTGLVLIAIASFESAFAARVVDCRVRGPGGAAGPFQTHRAIALACRSVADAARVALSMLRESWRVCAGRPLLDLAAFYTDGRCPSPWPRSRARVGRAVAWWTKHPRAWAEVARAEWQDWD